MSKLEEGLIQKSLPRIQKTLEADKEVLLTYLFGSQATGLAFSFSDVDFAILLKRGNTKYYLKKEEELSLKLMDLDLGGEIDIVLLNVAGIELAYSVINQGMVVFYRDEKVKVDYETKILLEYAEIKPYFDEYDRLLHEKIKAYQGK